MFAGLARAKIAELESGDPAETQSAARQIQPVAPEPEPQPAPQAEAPAPLAVEELSGVYVATKSANVRAAPATDAKIVAKLAVDQAVDATGQVAGGEWLRVSVKGKTGFVSGKLMAESDATEVAAWTALKSAPSEAGAQSFIADHPDGHFRPKAEALLAKLQAPKQEEASRQTVRGDAGAGGRAAAGRAGPDAAGRRDAGARRHHRAHRGAVPQRHRTLHQELQELHRQASASSRSTMTAAASASASATRPATGMAAAATNDPRVGAKKWRCRSAAAAAASSTKAPTKVGVFEIEYY